MTHITVELEDELLSEIRQRAEEQGTTVSRYLANLIRREVHRGWPAGFFEEVVGRWQGSPCTRAPQGNLQHRGRFDVFARYQYLHLVYSGLLNSRRSTLTVSPVSIARSAQNPMR